MSDTNTDEKSHKDWRCANCGVRPRMKHKDEPEENCPYCSNDDWYVDSENEQ